MRVALDVSPLVQTRAATAKYVSRLLERAEVEYVRLSWGSGGRWAALARDALWYPWLLSKETTEGYHTDLTHCPTFRAPVRRGQRPLVVTVHDLAVLRHPDAFNRWTRTYSRLAVPRVLGAADRVIAVSEFTRGELVDMLGVPPAKIRVVPNGVDERFSPDGPAETGDYVLAVGTVEPRKNLSRLVEACRQLGRELRIAGAEGWGSVDLAGGHVRPLGFVDDDRLAELYRGAACVAYPSLYEGFGIPVVEAMACGTPVVTSRGGATQEVAGGAAVLVDPRSPNSIAEGIAAAVERRHELVPLGLARASEFDWGRTARATVDVYRELA
jgi:glycosyltransferase involved in cell wall biosynthesis